MSKRYYDSNGYLVITRTPITKAGVFSYLGSEIGAPEKERVYRVFRPAQELELSIDSFKLQPFVDEHEWLGQEGTPAEKKGIQGVIGEQVYFEHPYLYANLKVHADYAKNLIEDGKIQLSAGYKCKYEQEAGTYEGQSYDYVQRDIACNHLALVEEGRSGPDVAVADRRATFDHNITTLDIGEVTMTLEEILKAIAELEAEEKEKLLASLGLDEKEEDEKQEDEVEERSAEEAADLAEEAAEALIEASELAAEAAATGEEADIEAAEEAVEEAEEKIEEVKEDLEAATMDKMKKRLKIVQVALDSLKRVKNLDEKTIIAMIAKRDYLGKRLVPHVGTFDYQAMDINSVAKYGVEKLGIKCAKGGEQIALDAALQVLVADSEKKTTDHKASRGSVSKFWNDKE